MVSRLVLLYESIMLKAHSELTSISQHVRATATGLDLNEESSMIILYNTTQTIVNNQIKMVVGYTSLIALNRLLNPWLLHFREGTEHASIIQNVSHTPMFETLINQSLHGFSE